MPSCYVPLPKKYYRTHRQGCAALGRSASDQYLAAHSPGDPPPELPQEQFGWWGPASQDDNDNDDDDNSDVWASAARMIRLCASTWLRGIFSFFFFVFVLLCRQPCRPVFSVPRILHGLHSCPEAVMSTIFISKCYRVLAAAVVQK